MDTVMIQHTAVIGIAVLCAALGIARATVYRRKRALAGQAVASMDELGGRSSVAVCGQGTEGATALPADALCEQNVDAARKETALVVAAPPALVKRSSPRALSNEERANVLAVLNEERFCNLAPSEIYATLLDEGTYLCSERTMYRILDENRQVRERRNQLRHPTYVKPELMACKPKQLWTWDITKLKTFVKSQYLHLYVILDVFSPLRRRLDGRRARVG